MEPPDRERYSRQIASPLVGVEGQRRLLAARVVVVGCGALGSVAAEILVRSGVGWTRIVDRDFLDLSNLQRQSLFTEEDVRSGLPKAVAAARHLRAINARVQVQETVADVHAGNILGLLQGAAVVLDGTDNFETRYLLNEACHRLGTPWVYGACLGSSAMTLGVIPGRTACLRCILPDPPVPGSVGTCDTAGILGPTVHAAAALQCAEALRILLGDREAGGVLVSLDLARAEAGMARVHALHPSPSCPLCHGGKTEFLERTRGGIAAVLCGGDGVQVTPASETRTDLAGLAARLGPHGEVVRNQWLVRFRTEGPPRCEIVFFSDGRAIVKGTGDPAVARGWLARWAGA